MEKQFDEVRLREWLITQSNPVTREKLRKQMPTIVNWELLDEELENLGRLLVVAMQRNSA